jgi:RimJ/RimL family protein N-acetyltransferase
VELATPRLHLRLLDPDRDAQTLHAAYSDPAAMAWWNTPLRTDITDTRSDLAALVNAHGAHIWAIGADDTTVGLVGLLGDVDVPGLTWLLRRPYWGRGYITESASAVIRCAFEQLALERVEAWVESTNTRSLATSRRLGLTEHGRLAQRYPHRDTAHQVVVLGASRLPEPAATLDVEASLPVRHIDSHLQLLHQIFGSRTAYLVGDPPFMAGVVFSPWSVGPRLRLVADTHTITPIAINIDVGTAFDNVYRQAVDAGAKIVTEPVEQPWGLREFEFRLSDGHHLVVSGPA